MHHEFIAARRLEHLLSAWRLTLVDRGQILLSADGWWELLLACRLLHHLIIDLLLVLQLRVLLRSLLTLAELELYKWQ